MSTQDTTSNEQKPSAEAIQLATEALRSCAQALSDGERSVTTERIAALFESVRRDARAEAFKFIEDELRAEGRTVSADYVEELAAKERAS